MKENQTKTTEFVSVRREPAEKKKESDGSVGRGTAGRKDVQGKRI